MHSPRFQIASSVAPSLDRGVLITGGLGFIGSALATRWVESGTKVTVIDNFLPRHGANRANLRAVLDSPHLTVIEGDVADVPRMTKLCNEHSVVYHLAGQIFHEPDSTDPWAQIRGNLALTAKLITALRASPRTPRLIYTGTRGQYGRACELPVRESHPMSPIGFHELTKLAAEQLTELFADESDAGVIALRLSNVYGPGAQVLHHHYGVLNWFVRLAVEGRPIPVMGDGRNRRDFLFIDDCVDALVACATVALEEKFTALNLGSESAQSFRQAAETLGRLAGTTTEYVPYSSCRERLEVGDFFPDISAARKLLGWQPKTDLETGLKKYYVWLQHNLGDYAEESANFEGLRR